MARHCDPRHPHPNLYENLGARTDLDAGTYRWPHRFYGWSVALLVPLVLVWVLLAWSGTIGLVQMATMAALLATWSLLAVAETVAWRTRNRPAN